MARWSVSGIALTGAAAATLLLGAASGAAEPLAKQAPLSTEPEPDLGGATSTPEPVATFSIVGYEPATGDFGVAVQSRFFAVGAVVPFASAGVGAVATQSVANTTYGPRGLEMLRVGNSASDVLAALTSADGRREQRQVAVIGAGGRAAAFTGQECTSWAGHQVGENYSAQGNILAGPEVVEAMGLAFETTEGDLATRLVAALAAGQAAGGDARGRQSAALLVVREGGGYDGLNDRYIDLRVDDNPAPIVELRRLLNKRHAQLASARAREALANGELDDALAAAHEATRLDPDSGFARWSLASVHLVLDDLPAAAAAARQALVRDPWIKTALLSGMLGSSTALERLLDNEDFARFWEALPGR